MMSEGPPCRTCSGGGPAMSTKGLARMLDTIAMRGIAGAAVLAAGVQLSPPAANAAWPEKPVRIISPNTPGGPTDIMARILAPYLQEALGGSFIVENVGGGGGNIGTARVARSDPDGYTLLLAATAFIINPVFHASVPYDPVKDFVAVAELGVSPNVIAVMPALGVKSIKELVAAASKDPNKFNIATPPLGTSSHLAAEMFKLRTGLKQIAIVFHTGGGQALQSIMSGATQINIGVLGTAHPQIQAGNVVGLAVTGLQRWHDLPNVPTMIDAGFKDYVTENITMMMAPAKTPADIVATLEKTTLAVLAKPDVRQRLTASGFQVTATTGKVFSERMARDLPLYRKLIQDAGVKPPEPKKK